MSQVAVIRATLKYPSQEALIEGMRPFISRSGLFIHTRSTRPSGSEVQFEFQLADGSITYSGEGIVRKEIPYTGEETAKTSGMLIALRRINKAFKEVVDTILMSKDDSEPGMNEPRSTSHHQIIVESRAGSSDGIDLFGDLDMDEGLDSLFAGIEKNPEGSQKHGMSGMYERPSVVSGLFQMPQEDELQLEVNDIEDLFGDDSGIAQSLMTSPDEQPSGEFDMRERNDISDNNPEIKERTSAKTGEFQQEANEVLMAERYKSNNSPNLSTISTLSGNRISPFIQQSPYTAVTGKFAATEELAQRERLHAQANKPGSDEVMQALAETQHELHNDDEVKVVLADVRDLLTEASQPSDSLSTQFSESEDNLDKTPEQPQTFESIFPGTKPNEIPDDDIIHGMNPDDMADVVIQSTDFLPPQSSDSLDNLLSQKITSSGHRRGKSPSTEEPAIPSQKVGFFKSLFKK